MVRRHRVRGKNMHPVQTSSELGIFLLHLVSFLSKSTWFGSLSTNWSRGMLCNCVLIEAAVIRQEEGADPAVISCCTHDKHHRHVIRKAFVSGKREKDGYFKGKPGQTALELFTN